MQSSLEAKIYTYQTRIEANDDVSSILDTMAAILCKVERKLYAAYCRGENLNKLKSQFLVDYGITARQFNAVRILLQGKIKSVLELQDDNIKTLKHKIKKNEKTIKLLDKKQSKTPKQTQKLHQLKRHLPRLTQKLSVLEYDKKNNIARICFGSKKLFKRQFNLAANNIDNHEEWLKQWSAARNNQFYLIGSKDETAGNQSCVATLTASGNLKLKVRLPNCLAGENGKYIYINDVNFAYGHNEILEAIAENNKRNTLMKKKNNESTPGLYINHGQAINYKFLRDIKGWRVFVTLEKRKYIRDNQLELGAIGIDLNVNHLAVTETDRTGNPIKSFNIPLCTYGKSTNQAKALIGDAVKEIVEHAFKQDKPIVVEKLDFTQKKKSLRDVSSRAARMLSSFAYSAILAGLKSRSFKYGLKVYEVNPAYSSIIGRVKFARLYKLSVHQAAALVIARRALGFSERLPRFWDKIPDNRGHRVTLPELVKIQGKHIWCSWAIVLKEMKTVLEAQYQMFRKAAMQPLLTVDDMLPF